MGDVRYHLLGLCNLLFGYTGPGFQDFPCFLNLHDHFGGQSLLILHTGARIPFHNFPGIKTHLPAMIHILLSIVKKAAHSGSPQSPQHRPQNQLCFKRNWLQEEKKAPPAHCQKMDRYENSPDDFFHIICSLPSIHSPCRTRFLCSCSPHPPAYLSVC